METEKNVVELELYFVRHGYSKTNAGQPANTPEERFDAELTPLGEAQAELLGRRFSVQPLDYVITSGLKRAQATAEAVLRHQPENGAHTMEILPMLTEWGITDEYSGKTMDEIKDRFPMAVPAPGAESFERMLVPTMPGDNAMDRAQETIDYLRARFKNGEKVMVAGHGNIGGFMLYAALGLREDEAFTLSIFNTSVTKIMFYKKGTGSVKDVGLVYLNDHSHLLEGYPTYSFTTI